MGPLEKLLARAMQDPGVSAIVVAELAETVAVDIRFSMRMADDKSRMGLEDVLRISEVYEEAVGACEKAWERYAESRSSEAELALRDCARRVREVTQ